MNIGIDIRVLSSSKLTGVGKYILNAVSHILEADKKNNYFLFSSGLKNNPADRLNFEQENFQHTHIRYSNKLLNLGFLSALGPRINNFFPKKIDLFWMPNLNFARFNCSTPLVLTVHDLSFLHSREFYSLRRRYWHHLVNVKRLVRRADKIIAVSDNTKRDIIRFFPTTKDKIEVINPGIDCNKMSRDRARELTKKFALPRIYFIYVGTLEPRKNISSIVKAFDKYHREFSDIDLVIVGGKGWVYEKLLKKINRRKYVHYLDYVDGPTKDALYMLSQGLIWPSFYEGFGFPPLEAVCHKIPVIASYKTSLPEIMQDQAIYVDPYNVFDIYQALKLLTKDDKLKEQFRQSADKFSIPQWPKQVTKIINLFSAIGTPRGDAGGSDYGGNRK
ncbi:glycosyltransferase family 4 protein [bacterium]|nr:glycosyltransferase family 4 protein [bacterium]